MRFCGFLVATVSLCAALPALADVGPTSLRLSIDGQPAGTGSTFARLDLTDTLDTVLTDVPAAGAVVTSPMQVSGMSDTFEARVSVRVRDQHGNAINDCSIHFNSLGGDARPRLLINELFQDTHQNKTSPDTTTFYLRLEAWDGSDWVDRLAQVNGVDFEIDCIDPKTQRIVFVPLRMRLNTALLARYLKPHRATLIDVELLRLPARDTFSMFPFPPRGSTP